MRSRCRVEVFDDSRSRSTNRTNKQRTRAQSRGLVPISTIHSKSSPTLSLLSPPPAPPRPDTPLDAKTILQTRFNPKNHNSLGLRKRRDSVLPRCRAHAPRSHTPRALISRFVLVVVDMWPLDASGPSFHLLGNGSHHNLTQRGRTKGTLLFSRMRGDHPKTSKRRHEVKRIDGHRRGGSHRRQQRR